MDFPSEQTYHAQYGTLSTVGQGCAFAEANINAGQAFNNASALVANLALYIPVIVPNKVTVTKFAWENGGTVSGNVDVGLYDWVGNQLVHSGSTAQTPISAVQVADTTDITINPGVYLLAIAADNATGLYFRSVGNGQMMRVSGIRQQATAFPLPTTATFAAATTATIVPLLIGVTSGATF